MRVLQKILSLFIVIAFLNVIIEKAVHEYFEHHTEVHTCIAKDAIHFHDFEYEHPDFICDFNLSTTFLSVFAHLTKDIPLPFQEQLIIKYLWIVKNNYLNNLLLRGPPFIK